MIGLPERPAFGTAPIRCGKTKCAWRGSETDQILSNTCDESLAFIKELTQERDALAAALAEIAQINPYDTSSMGFVVAKAQAAILRHNAGDKPPQVGLD